MTREKEIEVKKNHKSLRPLEPQYDRMVDRFFSDWPDYLTKSVSHVRETDQAFVISADVPGIRLEDIHIEVSGNMLRVHAESTEESGSQTDFNGYRSTYREFHQNFTLPNNVDLDQIQAHCENGHLKITLPKAENDHPRRIEINSGTGKSMNPPKDKMDGKKQTEKH
jgi:HSP20 family molecular chaperone IbpA